MHLDDDLLDLTPLAPVFVHPYDDVPDEPPPARQWSAPAPAVRAPSYGLVGVPSSTVRTRDAKVAIVGFGLGALVASLFAWLGRRRG